MFYTQNIFVQVKTLVYTQNVHGSSDDDSGVLGSSCKYFVSNSNIHRNRKVFVVHFEITQEFSFLQKSGTILFLYLIDGIGGFKNCN